MQPSSILVQMKSIPLVQAWFIPGLSLTNLNLSSRYHHLIHALKPLSSVCLVGPALQTGSTSENATWVSWSSAWCNHVRDMAMSWGMVTSGCVATLDMSISMKRSVEPHVLSIDNFFFFWGGSEVVCSSLQNYRIKQQQKDYILFYHWCP